MLYGFKKCPVCVTWAVFGRLWTEFREAGEMEYSNNQDTSIFLCIKTYIYAF